MGRRGRIGLKTEIGVKNISSRHLQTHGKNKLALQQIGDKNVLLTCMFPQYLSFRSHDIHRIIYSTPLPRTFLNASGKPDVKFARLIDDQFSVPAKDIGAYLPEDFHDEGQIWLKQYHPENFFDDCPGIDFAEISNTERIV
jgi:hypothetical protein